MLANQLQHFVNVNTDGMCEQGLEKLKTNLMMIRTETNLKYILIIKLIKIVIAKAIK